MQRHFLYLPFALQIFGVMAISMIVPSLYALVTEQFFEARMFFYTGLLGVTFLALIGLARSNQTSRETALDQMLSLALIFVFLPVFLAIPEYSVIRTTSFLNAYLDMVSALTTTGFEVFPAGRLSDTLHLWRALVGWMGGALIWVAAVAILAPLNLGGFELTAQHANARRQANFISTSERKLFLLRSAQTLMPLYIGLTGALWLGFILSGASGYSGFIFALSVLSTSGITAYQGVVGLSSGIWAEVLIVIFFTLALSRVFWAPEKTTGFAKGLFRDAELRLAIWITILLSCVLFIKQVASSTALLAEYGPEGLLALIWGNLFTILSFLSTTGWSSQYWQPIAPLSNEGIPGFLFLGLGLIGGGIATTAGGVKLLRFYILYLNALREVGRLVHPSSVGKTKSQNQYDLGQGAFAAWIFFMLFGLSLAGITLSLAASGLSFETALALCVSAISTTGPALMMVIEGPFDMIALPGLAKAILCLAMVLGRLEILVILALLRPEIWLRQ